MVKKVQIFLMRGLVREQRHWGQFPRMIKDRFPDSDICFLEIPGAGEHYQVDAPTTIRGMVDFMRQNFLKVADLSDGCERVLFAMSLGGMISADWIEAYPKDFTRAILANTSFKGISPMLKRFRPQNIPKLVAGGISSDLSRKERSKIEVISNRPEKYDDTEKLWVEIQRTAPVSVTTALRQLWAAAKFSPNIERPPIPILIMNSKKDRLVDSSCSTDIAEKWNVPICYHETAGHEISLDEPQWVVDQLDEWLTTTI